MQLGRIILFPIKSLDGVSVEMARITAGGILEHDRSYAIYDSDGKVVNGKRTPRVHDLRCTFDPKITEVRLSQKDGSPGQFQLDDPARISQWLSDFFGFPVGLRYEPQKGFPDDHTAFGPTITSEASLRTIQGWFPEMTLESVRRRFRTNLELTGGEPFGEDRLFGAPDELKPFRIGAVKFWATTRANAVWFPPATRTRDKPPVIFRRNSWSCGKGIFPNGQTHSVSIIFTGSQ